MIKTNLKLFLTALLALTLSACSSAEAKRLTNKPVVKHTQTYDVNGQAYTTTPSKNTTHYEKQGKASYYHNKFNGRRTASGEIYRSNLYTAAHNSLPLGSYALVTNTRNNRQVIVKINDRGPFHGERIIDLSRVAAADLGMLNGGVGSVKVEKLHVAKNQSYLSINNLEE
ncbi:septal ring lytic transglycosylase RlpA family protein [Actinobacillus porcinus]|uniref:septal ring lytic transglycosylase RlpA family protein n=1 Tax=Actinobacillus porcinus TaxID=51048 RepID=UPI0023564612|nr:septal ring lytic transglycosylase RlpA family protein [Actinobacillus porcinus]